MASSAEIDNDVVSAPPGKRPKATSRLVPMILAAAALISVLLLGGFYWLSKSGRMPLSPVAAPTAKTKIPQVPATHVMALEPMVVNLADEGGQTYLRIGMSLRVFDREPTKGDKPAEEKAKGSKATDEADAAVRDISLDVLGKKTAASLLSGDGKEQLKADLKRELDRRDPELKVKEIFLTEFLVQR